MVVDDETNILEQVKSCLENGDFEVVAVDSSRKALELMDNDKEDNFGLILIDTSMPDSKKPAFFSMKPKSKSDIDTSNEEDFLQKPFTRDQLVDFIKKKIGPDWYKILDSMQSKENDNIIFVKLFPEENVNEKLKEACREHNVKTAVVVSGIGQLKFAQLGYFKAKGNYSPETFNKPLEILSLTGNICKDEDDYTLHLHAILGDEKKNAIGGHFIKGKISVTGEIVLLKTDIDIQRKIDDKTGLKTLFLD